MKNLEQPINENLNKEGFENEKLFDNNNQTFTSKHCESVESLDEKINSEIGSENLGKFKDAESLLKAYNSLQAEFTKKSQRLSELENDFKPVAKSEKINATVEEIFNKYSIAEPFKEKLKQSLADIDSDNYVELAEQNLIKLLAENYQSPENLIKNEEFLSNYVLNNEEVKTVIIKEYLSKLKSVPNVKVTTNFNSSIPASPPNVVKTISEAGSIAKSIIKKQ
ncbi:MAG: hypothetical protein IJX26_03720 [Clostridia bacterium]|nr:hypothetical protein [Clostridia bacterium]